MLCFRVPVGGAAALRRLGGPVRAVPWCMCLADSMRCSRSSLGTAAICGTQNRTSRVRTDGHAAVQDEADMSLIRLDHLRSAASLSLDFGVVDGSIPDKRTPKTPSRDRSGDGPSYLRQWFLGAWPVLACRVDGDLQSPVVPGPSLIPAPYCGVHRPVSRDRTL